MFIFLKNHGELYDLDQNELGIIDNCGEHNLHIGDVSYPIQVEHIPMFVEQFKTALEQEEVLFTWDDEQPMFTMKLSSDLGNKPRRSRVVQEELPTDVNWGGDDET